MTLRLLRFGLMLGLVYGLLEGAAFLLLSNIPGLLSWRTANFYYAIWFAPLFYGAVFGIIAILVALLSFMRRTLPWEEVLLFVCVTLGAFLALSLPSLIWPLACLLLAIGVGARSVALYRRYRAAVEQHTSRGFPYLVMAVAVLTLGSLAFSRAREALAMQRLPRAAPERPNVVLLVIDTQRADHLSSYGYHRRTTPRIDQLASEGVLFERAYSHSSWTLPSHASMFNGRPMHEHRAGLVRRQYLDGNYPTLAEELRRAGYATGGFVANTYWCGRQTGLNRGFIRYEDMYGSAGDAFLRTVLGRLITYEVLPKLATIDIPGRKNARHITDDMLLWIDGLDGRPFFAFANYFDVHGPYLPPPETAGKFGWVPAVSSTGRLDIGALANMRAPPNEAEMRRLQAGYDESLLFVDMQIGRLVDELRKHNMLDNTVILVTSDHGESWGEHDVTGHGQGLWREQIEVPLIIRYPRAFQAGLRVSQPVANLRVAATVAQMTSVEVERFPGRSLTEAADSANASRDTVLVEVGRRSIAGRNWPVARGWVAGIVADRWHFIVEQSGRTELYDVIADAREEKNLAAEPEARTTLEAFRAHLIALDLGQGLDRGERCPPGSSMCSPQQRPASTPGRRVAAPAESSFAGNPRNP